MVTHETIAEIERLCAAGQDAPAISAAVGLSQSTVRKIIRGKHHLQEPINPEWGVRFSPTLERCPGCGGMLTELPCRLCLLPTAEASVAENGDAAR